MRLRNLLIVAACGLTLAGSLVVGASPAGADPSAGRNFSSTAVTCDSGLGTVTVVTFGQGRWTPALVANSNLVLIPYEFHFSGTFTPTGGTAQTFSEDAVKPAPRNGRLATCTAHQEGSDTYGTFVVDILVKVSYTKAP